MGSDGTISGTPTVSGTFNYTVTVKDSGGNSGTFNCSITVTAAAPTVACPTVSAFKGVAIASVTLTGTGGAGAPYTFTANGLPSGLTLSSSGTISGTPTVTGTFSYALTVKDKNGTVGTVNCTITVSASSTPACKVYGQASPPYMTYQDTGAGISSLTVNTNANNNFNVTVSPAPTGTTFSPTVPSQPYAMPAGEVIRFPQPTTSLVTVTASRINSSKSAQLTVTATNAAGATVTCDPISTVVNSLSWTSGFTGIQTFSSLPQNDHVIEIANGTPGLKYLAVLVNGVPFIEWNLSDGQSVTVDVSSAMNSGTGNTIMLIGLGSSSSASAQVTISQ
jgi:hypothetical protein